jgi:O-antigen/teichoic acid export membrane protein
LLPLDREALRQEYAKASPFPFIKLETLSGSCICGRGCGRAAIFRLLTPTILVFGIINPTGWLLHSVGLHGRSLRISLVIAPLVIAACLIGLPYGPNGIAFAFSAAMTLWLVPHVVWCLHNTMISP